MKPAKPKTVRLRLSAEYNLDSDSAQVLLFCDPKSAFGFLTSQFKLSVCASSASSRGGGSADERAERR